MTDRLYTVDEKIAELEGLIVDFRWARSEDAVPENRTYRILKQIVKELRSTQTAKPNAALAELTEAISAARESKGKLGYPIEALQALAWAVIEHWGAIRAALEGSQHD
jgi:hypothetical protein